MPHFLSKLTSCIHRPHVPKNIKPLMYSECTQFLKLSRFELMGDEILVQIFEYIPLTDLYNGFVNLNFRLNILLRDVRLGIHFNQNSNSNSNILNSLYYFSKQISYIHIDHNPLLNLTKFVNLHSLILYLPTKSQLFSINNKFLPNLHRLWIGIINKSDQNILCENLFGKTQFPKLYFCNFFQINFNENVHLYENCFYIKKLFITNISTKDFLILLLFLPNLYQLEICISDVLLTFEQNFKDFSHQNLRILKIEFFEKIPQLNKLNNLISFVPYVQRCTLILVNLIQIKDYIILQNILNQKLLELKQFICSIDYYCQLSSNQMIPKFHRLKIKLPFFQTMKIIPCAVHQDKCLRKTFMNKTFSSHLIK